MEIINKDNGYATAYEFDSHTPTNSRFVDDLNGIAKKLKMTT